MFSLSPNVIPDPCDVFSVAEIFLCGQKTMRYSLLAAITAPRTIAAAIPFLDDII